jgi:hypothetical protein
VVIAFGLVVPALLVHVGVVVRHGPQRQVIWVHTGPYIARVHYNPPRYVLAFQVQSEAVSLPGPALSRERAIALGVDVPGPQVAVAGAVYSVFEGSHLNGFPSGGGT